MRGLDLSHHNKVTDWSKVKKNGESFCILKATQGTTWVDEKFREYRMGAENAGFLLGFYHFANGENAQQEAQHFIETVGQLKEGQFLVLDYEINLKNPAQWCRDWLDYVYRKTGVRPLLYTNEARVKSKDWSKVVTGNYGLWVAKYGLNTGQMGTEPTSGQWAFWAIWQFTSRGKVPGIVGNVDLNYTKMDLDALKKYGAMPPEPQNSPESDLNEELMVYPIDKVYITQEFGERPEVYKQFGMKGHNGIDFRTRFVDSPLGHRYVQAVKGGEVIELGNDGSGGYGIYVRLKHKGTEQTIYGHLKKWYVKKGQIVKKGEVIALTDNTGFSTGSHLHLGWRPNNYNYNNGYKGYEDCIHLFDE